MICRPLITLQRPRCRSVSFTYQITYSRFTRSSSECQDISCGSQLAQLLGSEGETFLQVIRVSNEEAIASMQNYKAGLSKALNSKEDSLRSGTLRAFSSHSNCCL